MNRESVVLIILIVLSFFLLPRKAEKGMKTELFPYSVKTCLIETSSFGRYTLKIDKEVFLGNPSYEIIGRIIEKESNDIKQALSNVKILSEIDSTNFSDKEKKDFGIDKKITIKIPSKKDLNLSIAKNGFFYAWQTKAEFWRIDKDIYTILNRNKEILRKRNFDLPNRINEIWHSRGWKLSKKERWWIHSKDKENWCDQETIETLLKIYQTTKAISYTTPPKTGAKNRLVISGLDKFGFKKEISIIDYGQSTKHENARIIQRVEEIGKTKIRETMIVSIPKNAISIMENFFLPTKLLPMQVSEIHYFKTKEHEFNLKNNSWKTNGRDDINSTSVWKFLQNLGKEKSRSKYIEKNKSVKDDSITIKTKDASWSCKQKTKINLYDFIDKRILPITQNEIIAICITPKNKPPQIFEKTDNKWSDEMESDIIDFIEPFLSGKVIKWIPKKNKTENYDSIITISTKSKTHIIKLTATGLVSLPNRKLHGVLDANSIKRIIK